MTVLPIIERELRVQARNRPSYWTRFAAALVGVLVCLPQLIWPHSFGPTASPGPGLLNAIVGAAFLVCCAACLLTADMISSERREGTLGLLLLTRVGALDLLLGKLGSAGLTSLCALVALLPVLMLPVLAGGVTGGEVVRKALVLPNTLFLAVAAGLWASARGCEWFKTARTALLLLAILLFGPGLVGLLPAQIWGPGPAIGLLSPLGTLFSAGDASYKASPVQYWISLSLVQAAGWALLINAGLWLRRSWREERSEATVTSLKPARAAGLEPDGPWLSCSWTPPVPESAAVAAPEAARRRSSPLDDDVNPIAWLLRRQRGTRAILWAGALVGLAYEAFLAVGFRFTGPGAYMFLIWPLSLATTTVGSALFAWAASRFFVEARRTGELELLLTTPLGAKQIVSTQWQVLKRLLLWPMLVLLAPVFLRAVYAVAISLTSSGGVAPPSFAFNSLLGCVIVFLEVGALCWVGLWFGLRAKGQARAIVQTVVLVKVLPYSIYALYQILLLVLVRSWSGYWGTPYWIMSWLPQVVGLLFYLVLIRLARHRLLGELAGADPTPFDFRQVVSSAARRALAALRKARHWTPS